MILDYSVRLTTKMTVGQLPINVLIATALSALTLACAPSSGGDTQTADIAKPKQAQSADINTSPASEELAFAYVAGGCFWCVESDFEKVDGVHEVYSGYTGGDLDNPTYKQVSAETTGHYEAAKIVYDRTIVSYASLIDYFFRHVDPLDDGGQFCDRGLSYRTAIFVTNDEERAIAIAAKQQAETELGQPVVTPIVDLKTFWLAEDYHQDYYKKNPVRYGYYRRGCGRDRQVAKIWGTGNHDTN